MSNKIYYHDLKCWTGLGDRLLNVWAVMTLVELISPESPTLLRWMGGKPVDQTRDKIIGKVTKEAGLRKYSTNLFTIENCEFTDERPENAPLVLRPQDTEYKTSTRTINADMHEIFLKNDNRSGPNHPARIKSQTEFYGLNANLPLETIVSTYQKIAGRTSPSPILASSIPADIEKRVGIHIRRSDKLVNIINGWEMSPKDWRAIELYGKKSIDRCIARSEPMFIASDDAQYRDNIVSRIRSKGGDVIVAPEPTWSDTEPGFSATLDFFCLAKCKRIIQFTKYSTFSMGAAIISGRPLTNFILTNNRKTNHIYNWEHVLPLIINSRQELGTFWNLLLAFQNK